MLKQRRWEAEELEDGGKGGGRGEKRKGKKVRGRQK